MAGDPWGGPGVTVRLAGVPIRIEPAFALVIARREDFASLAGNPAFEAIRASGAVPEP